MFGPLEIEVPSAIFDTLTHSPFRPLAVQAAVAFVAELLRSLVTDPAVGRDEIVLATPGLRLIDEISRQSLNARTSIDERLAASRANVVVQGATPPPGAAFRLHGVSHASHANLRKSPRTMKM